MFSKKIIDTDWFMDMPSSSQNLYFHLSMRADDDGFVANPKRIIKLIGASEDDYKLLIVKSFIIPFESGVCVITDWRINNYLRNDRYTSTIYQKEKAMLKIDENGKYISGIPVVYQDKSNSISNSISINNNIIKEEKKEKEEIPYGGIIDYLNEKTGKKYKATSKETQRHIKARFNEGFKLDDFKRVIDIKSEKWKGDPKMQDYLRPETLFGNKFEGYLNEAPKVEEIKEKSAQEIWAEKERQKQIEEAEERRRSEEEDRKFREEHPNVDMEKFHQLLRAGRFQEAHDYISKN